MVYHTADGGDPMFVTDRTGASPRQILIDNPGYHNHYPVWSRDGQWIYFVRGFVTTSHMDLWRISPKGGEPERLTEHNSEVSSPAPLDLRTIVYVARDRDGSGPWLWALDVNRKATHRISFGLEKYASVAASADGRHLVATEASPIPSLWSVPILNRVAEERDAKPYPVGTARALGPRFGGSSLFYLSSRGTGDGLWRFQDGQTTEIWKGSDGALLDPPAVSGDGRRVAIALGRNGKLTLHLATAEGNEFRPLGESIDISGAADWSRDGQWIVAGGTDAHGPGVFKIPVGGGIPVRLTTGQASNPVWSPAGNLIDRICRTERGLLRPPLGRSPRWNSGKATLYPGASRRRARPLRSRRFRFGLHAGTALGAESMAARSRDDEEQRVDASRQRGRYSQLRYQSRRQDRV
jgi:hypothetical protein